MNYELTIAWIETWFDKFNHDYFDGGLPRPRLAVSKSRTRLGSMSFKRRMRRFKAEYYDYSIRISNYYDQDERQYQNVLLHEMIHYSIAYSGVKDTAPHGVVFRGMMDAFNRKYGWNITVTTSTRGVNVAAADNKIKVKRRLILAIKMRDGRKLLSVVNPRYARDINNNLKRQPSINNFRWYISDDDYFSPFPVVRSMRGMVVKNSLFDYMTSKMEGVFF